MLKKRQILVGFLALAAAAGAWAQSGPAWPMRGPIKLVAVFPPGGSVDQVARILAQPLAAQLGANFIVENKGGASGSIGAAAVAAAPADGYTFAVVFDTFGVNPALIPGIPYDSRKDLAPVVLVGTSPMVLATHVGSEYKNFADVVAAARAKKSVGYGTIGSGSLGHLAMSLLGKSGQIDWQHIPYKGVGPAMVDVLGGQVPIVFASLPSALSNIREGKLRALAVSTEKRSPALPDVPAIAERIPGFGGELWIALFGVAGTPPEIIDTLYRTTARVMQKPSTQQKLADQGVELAFDTPDQLRDRLARELVKWRKIVETSGARVD